MRASLGLVLFVSACGSKQPAPKPAPVENKQQLRASVPARATCLDVGVILRGDLDVESTDDKAGPAKEATITAACQDDKWPQSVIDCVAGKPRPHECLDELDETRMASYEVRIGDWYEEYVDQASGGFGTTMNLSYVDCDDKVIGDPALHPPAVSDQAPERDFTVKLRRAWIQDECEHEWSESLKQCLSGSTSESDRNVCFTKDGIDMTHLAKQLVELEQLAKKIAGAKQKPASITCKKVVASHYGDAAWKQKLDGYKAAERKKMITASRSRMTKTCTADNWDDTLRACVVSGGGETCFEAYGMRFLWGYPAAGVVTTVGVPECDEYGAAVMAIATCDKLPQQSRDALVQSFQQMQAQIASSPANERAKMASSCKAGHEAIANVASSVGC